MNSKIKIIADTREGLPYTFEKYDCEVIKENLTTGDYSIKGMEHLIAIDRKSLSDLTGTMTSQRERFKNECVRGAGLEYFGMVVEASIEDIRQSNYRSKVNPHALLQSLYSFSVKYNLHIHFAGSRSGGEYVTYSLLDKFLAKKQQELTACLKHQGE